MATVAERLASQSVPEPNSGCLLWLGGCSSTGYGEMNVDGKIKLTHRLAFELAFGPIPPKAYVLHRCDVRSCISPAHLFCGNAKINAMDMAYKGRSVNQKKTQCSRGHDFLGANVIHGIGEEGRPRRRCRICYNMVSAAGKRRRRAAKKHVGGAA